MKLSPCIAEINNFGCHVPAPGQMFMLQYFVKHTQPCLSACLCTVINQALKQQNIKSMWLQEPAWIFHIYPGFLSVSNFQIIRRKKFHKSWEIRHLCTWFCELFPVIDVPFLPRSLFSSPFYFPRAFHCVCLNRKRAQSVTAVLKESQGGTWLTPGWNDFAKSVRPQAWWTENWEYL